MPFPNGTLHRCARCAYPEEPRTSSPSFPEAESARQAGGLESVISGYLHSGLSAPGARLVSPMLTIEVLPSRTHFITTPLVHVAEYCRDKNYMNQ